MLHLVSSLSVSGHPVALVERELKSSLTTCALDGLLLRGQYQMQHQYISTS